MPTPITMVASVFDKFSKLINKNVYEPRLCNLMNKSSLIFPGQYQWITEQSSGQCDFIEIGTGIKFDAKLPFFPKHGKLIGSNNHGFKKWIELMQQEEAEFGEDIVATRGNNISSLELYKIMECRLESIELDEHVIFFIPYPIVLDSKEFEFIHSISDYLDAIFRELKKKNKVGSRNIYVIYPAIDGDIVLRCLNDNSREFLHFSEFDEFITYSLKP